MSPDVLPFPIVADQHDALDVVPAVSAFHDAGDVGQVQVPVVTGQLVEFPRRSWDRVGGPMLVFKRGDLFEGCPVPNRRQLVGRGGAPDLLLLGGQCPRGPQRPCLGSCCLGGH